MGWLASLFSDKKIVSTGIDLVNDSVRGVGTWIDDLNLTEEEKVKYRQQMTKSLNEFIEQRLKESGAQTISRRILAWGIMGTFLVFFVFGAVAWFFDPAWSVFLLKWVNQTGMYWLVLSVGSFYFGTHMLRTIFESKKRGNE